MSLSNLRGGWEVGPSWYPFKNKFRSSSLICPSAAISLAINMTAEIYGQLSLPSSQFAPPQTLAAIEIASVIFSDWLRQ